MGILLTQENGSNIMQQLCRDYDVYAPKVFEGEGCFSDTDSIRYGQVKSLEEIVWDKKAEYSFKEVLLPVSETLFYFTEDQVTEPAGPKKERVIFLRACDGNALKRLDEIYLRNGAVDVYYKRVREMTHFILMGCAETYENCFCVSMGTNKWDEHDVYMHRTADGLYVDSKWDAFGVLLSNANGCEKQEEVQFVTENKVKVHVPKNLNQDVMKSDMWKEYSARCIACGRCNFVCPTCTCFTMQDIHYKDNPKNGERRRVWASCHVDGYTEMAGGHGYRQEKGQRMRFKVMHKVYDYKERFGYHMCVGCGRCDDVCPEYISFSNCVNKLEDAMKEVQ